MNANEIVQPNLFPFPFPVHLIFSCIALFFFAYLFSRTKKAYQLVMAIAIPFSLAIWISESRVLFYTIGAIELILLVTAFVLSVVSKKKSKTEKAKTEPTASADSSENSEDKTE